MNSEYTTSTADTTAGRPTLTRMTPPEALLTTSTLHFKQKMSADAEREKYSIENRVEHLAKITTPLRRLIEQSPDAVTSLKVLHQFAKEEKQQRTQIFKERAALRSPQTLSFTANYGFQIIAPPYDLEWHHGDYASARRNTGEIFANSIIGDGTAAIGVFFSSPVRSLVRVAPFAPLAYDWSVIAYDVPVVTRGSVGIVVYINGNPRPAFDYRANLWDTYLNFPPLSRDGASGSSTVGEALSRHVLITVEPGNTYLLWIWCSVYSSAREGHLSFDGGYINCDIPFMVVDAGPPPLLR